MTIATLTFKLYTDSGLTSVYSGATTYAHKTDLSDNPQDLQLWFGSAYTAGARSLQAVSNPGVDQITLTPTNTTPAFVPSVAYVLGQQVEPTTPNTYYYTCTTAGTASTEPTWPTTVNNTVTTGTATFTCSAKKHPTTEVKLALTSGGLSSAVAGAALDLGTTILSGSANAVQVNMRITNSVITASDDTGYPQLAVYINTVKETIA